MKTNPYLNLIQDNFSKFKEYSVFTDKDISLITTYSFARFCSEKWDSKHNTKTELPTGFLATKEEPEKYMSLFWLNDTAENLKQSSIEEWIESFIDWRFHYETILINSTSFFESLYKLISAEPETIEETIQSPFKLTKREIGTAFSIVSATGNLDFVEFQLIDSIKIIRAADSIFEIICKYYKVPADGLSFSLSGDSGETLSDLFDGTEKNEHGFKFLLDSILEEIKKNEIGFSREQKTKLTKRFKETRDSIERATKGKFSPVALKTARTKFASENLFISRNDYKSIYELADSINM